MGYSCEGEVYIPLEDFWEFVSKYVPVGSAELAFGVPKPIKFDIVIPYAANTECHPTSQTRPPEFMKEWGDIKG